MGESAEKFRAECLRYLDERTGRLEYRFIRYGAVADELYALGFTDRSILCDVGAGAGDFDFYLRAVRGFKGRYLPIDGAIDGVELNTWAPHVSYDFITALEIIEHLQAPDRLVDELKRKARYGLVITTPNTDTLGFGAVLEMDRTHIHPVREADLWRWGAKRVENRSFFGQKDDSFLAVF